MQEKFNLPLLGDDFPRMTVHTTYGTMTLPDDYRGKWWVLFSHPADFTPVCTTEFVGFQNRIEEFRKLGAELIGMSIDQVFSHIKWVEWIREKLDVNIEFPIISGNDAIALQLGMLHPGKGTSTVRAVFVMDPQSKVRLMLYYPQEIGRNIDEVVRVVQALQLSDREGAVPADWPKNELLGDRVIVPPPRDIREIEGRREKYECYDWWFCHKPLEQRPGA